MVNVLLLIMYLVISCESLRTIQGNICISPRTIQGNICISPRTIQGNFSSLRTKHYILSDAILPPRALDRKLQEDWARDAGEGLTVLMGLRVDFGPMGSI